MKGNRGGKVNVFRFEPRQVLTELTEFLKAIYGIKGGGTGAELSKKIPLIASPDSVNSVKNLPRDAEGLSLKENSRSSQDGRLLPRRRMNETYIGIDPALRLMFKEMRKYFGAQMRIITTHCESMN
jgi:hypothetical protein